MSTNAYDSLADNEKMPKEEVKAAAADAKEAVKEAVEDGKEKAAEVTEEAKGVLGTMWSAVSSTVGAVVGGAQSVASAVVDATLGASHTAVDKTAEVIHNHPVVEGYVEAGKEKVATLAAAAGEYIEASKQSATTQATDLVEAGKEKAAALTNAAIEAGKEKLHNYPTAEGYVNAGVEKATAAAAVASEYLEAGKVKVAEEGGVVAASKAVAADLTAQAKVIAPQVLAAGQEKLKEYPAVEGYVNAGVAKAGELVAAGQEKLKEYPTVEGYVNAGIEKASALGAAAGDKLGVAAEQAQDKAKEVKDAAKEKVAEVKDEAKEHEKQVQHAQHEKKVHEAEVKAEVKELFERTHGDETDFTGHIVVAPGHKEEKSSAYVGGWETVEKGGHHHPEAPAKN